MTGPEHNRLARGLADLSRLGRELSSGQLSLPDLLQLLVDEAKALTQASFSALLLLRDDHPEEISHFVYNAPRALFPERLPRAVGLLAVPLRTGAPVALDDIRGHAAGRGIPVEHPPIGPLLAAPIHAGMRVVGEVAVANQPERQPFDEVDMQLLVELAAHAGIAVSKAVAQDIASVDAETRREQIATARHDVRNPLTIAKGYVSMLESRRDRMTAEQITTALAAARVALERIEVFVSRALVDDDAEPIIDEPAWTTLSVAEVLDTVAADHTATARDVGTAVVVRIEDGTPSTFAGDPGMTREILDNIVVNAIKYGASSSPVTVTARAEGSQVRFDIHNHGPGIRPGDQPHLFDVYWRSEGARAGTVPGTGLGLAIVRRLVELHGGVVGVTSRPDEGTTFWVTFPQQLPPLPADETAQSGNE